MSPIMLEMVGQEASLPSHIYSSQDFEPELNVPTFNIMKKVSLNNHIDMDDVGFAPFQNTISIDGGLRDAAANATKLHHCDLCGKKFSKVSAGIIGARGMAQVRVSFK